MVATRLIENGCPRDSGGSRTRNRVLFCGTLAMFGIASAALGGEITTTFASNGAISPGGAAYFDIFVGVNDLEITSFVQNSGADLGASFGFEVYTTPVTYVGHELNAAAWTLQATGIGTGNGPGASPDEVVLSNSFTLNARGLYGMAIVLPDASQNRTNGNGTNQFYSTNDISITLGVTTNTAFAGSLFSPRVWNGTIRFTELRLYGDLDCNGVVDDLDIGPFVLALIDKAAYSAAFPDCDSLRADINVDGAIDGVDVGHFVDLLLGP